MAGNLTRPGRGRLFPLASPRVSGSGPISQAGSVLAAQVALTVPGSRPVWLEVPGGILPASRWRPTVPVPDLVWAAAPVTVAAACGLGLAACGDPALPVTGLDWRTAQAVAVALGGLSAHERGMGMDGRPRPAPVPVGR